MLDQDRQIDEELRLQALRQTGLLGTAPEAVFDDLAVLAASLCDVPIALVNLVDADSIWLKARVGIVSSELPRAGSFCGHAIASQQTLVVPDTLQDPRFAQMPMVVGPPHLRFYAGTPLIVPDGHALGTLCILDTKPRDLSPRCIDGLARLGRQAAALLEARRQGTAARIVANRAVRKAQLLDLTHDAVFVLDLRGRITYWNHGAEKMFDFSQDEAVGKVAHELLHVEGEQARRERRQAMAEEGRWEGELELTAKDGHVIMVDSRWTLQKDTQGDPQGVMILSTDITRRKAAERTNALYAEIVANMQTGLHTFRLEDPNDDHSLRIVSSNPAAARLLGKDEGMVGLRIDEVFHRSRELGLPALYAKIAREGGSAEFETVKLPGPTLPRGDFACKAFAIPPDLVGVTFESITERKQAQAALQSSEQRLRAVFDTVGDGIVLIDSHGDISSLNPAAERLFGVTTAQAAGQKAIEWVRRASGDDDDATWVADAATSALRECHARRADGSVFEAEMRLSMFEVGKERRYVAVIRDVTERKELDRLKDEFVSTVSHELRTPLTSIRGALGLLEAGVAGPLEAAGLEMVRIARSNSERLVRLINDILDLEKMESGRLDLSLAPLDPERLGRATLEQLAAMAAEAGVALTLTAAAAGTVSGDEDRLVQVLTNLLSNAITFSPPGAKVDVHIEQLPGSVRFSVQDQGPGIAPNDLKRLFGKFQQLDGSDRRQRRGTGLGLAISKAIIEQHGGRIGVQSQVGVGSTFWFELPVPMARTPEPDRPQALVVVVDDDASFRSVLALRLRSMGIDCVEAADGAEAISEIRNHKPDLIILDVGLPRPDGFEVVDILRRDGARQTPLLVYTGRDLTREDAKRLSLGRTRHLTKSRASEETFVEAVRGLLRGEKS